MFFSIGNDLETSETRFIITFCINLYKERLINANVQKRAVSRRKIAIYMSSIKQ